MPGLLDILRNPQLGLLSDALQKYGLSQYVTTDARRGELGWVRQPYGVSTELSTTLQDPRLMNGKPVNIPLLVKGQSGLAGLLGGAMPTDEQYEIAIRRAIDRIKAGAFLPTYKSIQEAELAAQNRPLDQKMNPYVTHAGMFSDFVKPK